VIKKSNTKFLLFFLTIWLSTIGVNDVFGQIGKASLGKKNQTTKQDSVITPSNTILVNPIDSTIVSTEKDSTTVVETSVKLSKDSLETAVIYEATDSMIYDVENQYIYLYGDAKVTYDGMTLTADYIEFDWENSIATAEGQYDSLGNLMVKPVFKDKDNEFTSTKMRYNFKTHKGKVYDVRTKEGDGYLLSQGVKFDLRSNLNSAENDVVYAESTLYTTCDHDHPHFGIRSKKAKIIPQKLIVVGPSNVEIANVPTPLWLPFGFFPIQQGRRSGVVFPRDYEFDPNLGFGLNNVGYYFAGNEFMDFTVLGSIYTRGTWGLSAGTNYRKMYKYNGRLNLRFNSRKLGYRETPDFSIKRDFFIDWSHSQDSRAHPYINLGGSINLGTGSFFSNTQNDYESVVNNQFSSNLSLRKTFPNKLYNLTASFQHQQSTLTNLMTITFPVVDFTVARVFPFKRTNPEIKKKEQWFEKINFNYAGKVQNRTTVIDSLLFTSAVFEDMRYGVTHRIPISASFKLAKYFTFTQSVQYQDFWHLNSIEKRFIDQETIDSLGNPVYGTVETIEKNSFRAQPQISATSSLSTEIYGMMNFKFKRLKAIRHVMKPSINANFSPDYSKGPFNYIETVQNDTRDPFSIEEYNVFEGNLYGSSLSPQQASISWNINNNLEAKVRSRKDTVQKDKKIPILNQLNIGSSYNFADDSLQFKPINITGTTKLFKRINIRFNANYSPYQSIGGIKVDKYYWTTNRKPLNFQNAGLTVGTSFKPSEIRDLFSNDIFGTKPLEDQNTVVNKNNSSQGFVGALSLNYTFNITKVYDQTIGRDTIKISRNVISLSQTVLNISKNWRITIGGIGYDFALKGITYTDVGFYRDLHCWEMGVTAQPERGTFSFFIRVKPGSLDFLNMPYKRNNVSPIRF